MFEQSIQRLGFACKFYPEQDDTYSQYNTKTTTAKWLQAQTQDNALERLRSIIEHNLDSQLLVFKEIIKGPIGTKMMRLSSDLLPFYTHNDWNWVYKDKSLMSMIKSKFLTLGKFAKLHDIRLSFHPGQYCCIASDRAEVVDNSIQELEYHRDMAVMMGFGNEFQDFKINVHLSGRLGEQGARQAFQQMTPELRNMITIENDEFGKGLEDVLEISDLCPIVLDIHHHLIRTSGEYILKSDDRVQKVIESWQGVRPVMHYSISREEYINDCVTKPDITKMLSEGYKLQKLRAHSDYYVNHDCNNWCLNFWDEFDIMCESKAKNRARDQLYEYFTQQINLLGKT